MANEYCNLLEAEGPPIDLMLLRDELDLATEHAEPLTFHVPLRLGATREACKEAWGTQGSLWATRPELVGGKLEWRFDTANAPVSRWVEQLSRQRPGLTLRIFFSCMLEGVGGVLVLEGGSVLSEEVTRSEFGPFFAARGRPGFFVPYWEDEDGNELTEREMAGDEPSLEEFGALHDAEQGAADAELSLALLFHGSREEAARHFYPAGEHAGPTLAEAGEFRSIAHRQHREAELRRSEGFDPFREALAAMQVAVAGDLSRADQLLTEYYSDPDELATSEGLPLGSLAPLVHALDNVTAYAHAHKLLDAAEPVLCQRLAGAGLDLSACRRPAPEAPVAQLNAPVREATLVALYYELYRNCFRNLHGRAERIDVEQLAPEQLASRMHRPLSQALAATTADSGAAALHLQRWLGATGFNGLQQAYARVHGLPMREGGNKAQMSLSIHFVTWVYEEVLIATVDGRTPADAVREYFKKAVNVSF